MSKYVKPDDRCRTVTPLQTGKPIDLPHDTWRGVDGRAAPICVFCNRGVLA